MSESANKILELLCEDVIFADFWDGRGNVLMVEDLDKYFFPMARMVRVWEIGSTDASSLRHVDARLLERIPRDHENVARLMVKDIFRCTDGLTLAPGGRLQDAPYVVGLTTVGCC